MRSILIWVFIFSFSLIAENIKAQSIQLETGVNIGLNVSALTSMNNSYEPLIGYLGGVSVEGGYMARRLTVESGILYTRFGANRNIEGINTDFIRDYIMLPVFLKYYYNGYGFSDVYFFTGPNINYLMSSKIIYGSGASSINRDFKDQTTNFLYSMNAGIGSKFQKGNMLLTIRLQLSTTLNDVYNGEELSGGRNSNVTLITGIIF